MIYRIIILNLILTIAVFSGCASTEKPELKEIQSDKNILPEDAIPPVIGKIAEIEMVQGEAKFVYIKIVGMSDDQAKKYEQNILISSYL